METNYMDFLPLAIGLSVTMLSAYLAYRYALMKMRKESVENIERYKYEAILQAHRGIYKLLRFTTNTENEDSILVWDKPKESRVNTVYYFRQENIINFIKELTDELYKKGYGIFLSKEILELIFEYRNIVYGLLLSTKGNTNDKIKIENEKCVNRLINIHHELSKEIRTAINLKQRNLKIS